MAFGTREREQQHPVLRRGRVGRRGCGVGELKHQGEDGQMLATGALK